MTYHQLVVMICLVMGLAACSTKEGRKRDVDAQIALINAEPTPPIEPIPAFKPLSVDRYAASHIHSPFDAPQTSYSHSMGQPDQDRPKEELEAYPLDALNMVGTLRKGDIPWVLIMGPNGMIYHLTLGNYLGQNYGKIKEISDQQLTLIETVPDGIGGWKERNVEVTIVNSGQGN